MPRLSHQALRRAASTHARAATLAALLPLIGATALSSPAKAASVSCQAIDASGLVQMMPTIPSPACTTPVSIGDTFEIDFSQVFNPTDFSINNTYSLQIANINTGPTPSILNFTDVELLITGKFETVPGNPATEINFTTPTAISIWQASGQTGQGFTNYSTNGDPQDFGFGEAFKSANFTLTAPQPLGTFGTAGVINTIAFNLAAAGVTQFDSALIRGKLAGANNISANPDFSAGLAIFTDLMVNPMAPGTPDIIYGNAFNAVPGPLPIVGAGAAFGWSRRLRQRVRKAKASAASSLA